MKRVLVLIVLVFSQSLVSAHAAYRHGGDTDSDVVLQAYPAVAGTKLDSCALCHTGGEYEKKPGVWVALGSCQWCHYNYGYDASGDIADTLNSYGDSFNDNGKNQAALEAIEELDADGDGYSNLVEIAALRYPGNADDDPLKVAAPYRIITKEQLEAMLPHSQFMLMNTHKSGDFYAEYTGVPISELLDDSGILASATGITAFAPDGWAQYHPLEEDNDPLLYHVYGTYPQAEFFYNTQADEEEDEGGWCDYSSLEELDMEVSHGDPIEVENGLRLILAYARNNEYLQPGELNDDNKLDGEGPFRVVPPQKTPGPPDQSIKSDAQNVVWPFDDFADHNAGFATRSATIIRVEPLPEGTTDIDTMEAGWDYVDEGKVLIYGAIDPLETILQKLTDLQTSVGEHENDLYKRRWLKRILEHRLAIMYRLLDRGHERAVNWQLKSLTKRFNGCTDYGQADRNDWMIDCDEQLGVYWSLHEITVLLGIDT